MKSYNEGPGVEPEPVIVTTRAVADGRGLRTYIGVHDAEVSGEDLVLVRWTKTGEGWSGEVVGRVPQ